LRLVLSLVLSEACPERRRRVEGLAKDLGLEAWDREKWQASA